MRKSWQRNLGEVMSSHCSAQRGHLIYILKVSVILVIMLTVGKWGHKLATDDNRHKVAEKELALMKLA